MSETQGSASRGRDLLRSVEGIALLGLLTLAATSIHRSSAVPHGSAWAAGAISGLQVVIMISACAVLVAVLAAVAALLRRQGKRDPDPVDHAAQFPAASRWAKLVAFGLVLAVVAAPLAIVFALASIGLPPLRNRAGTAPPGSGLPSASTIPTSPSVPQPGQPVPAGAIWLFGGLVIFLGLLAYLAFRSHRLAASQHLGRHLPVEDRQLTDITRHASAAAELPTDPRAAILACYRSIESDLGREGTSRGRGETPEEFLTRAAAQGQVAFAAAGRLCRLFDEARFSTHAITAAQRGQAIAALHSLRSEPGALRSEPGALRSEPGALRSEPEALQSEPGRQS